MNKTKENTGVDVKPDNSGHRERLKKRFMLGGGRDFPDYEMLELLLTLSIPRRDVKQIAKQLLAKFGSFAGVINAPAAALYEVPYVKENSYVVFSIVREAAIRSSWSSLQDKAAMFRGARAIILVHNHPSGDVTPSHADLDITNKINVAAHAVGIKLFDHLIVSKNGYFSFKDHGLIAELKN